MAPTSVTLAAPPAHALHPFDGFGAQFNTNLFTDAGQPQSLSPAQHGQLADTVANLKPGHSRIFLVRGVHAAVPPESKQGKELAALMKTMALADSAGANVNLTYWGQGPYAGEAKLRALAWPNPTVKKWPQAGKQKWPAALTDGTIVAPAQSMARFAGIVEKARRDGLGCITHLTIQNEVNGSGTDIAKQHNPNLSMRFYELLYRHLDSALKALPDPQNPGRSLRTAVKVVAGDLVLDGNSPQDAWLEYLHANMDVPREGFPSVIDGYSIHVYWDPGPGGQGFPAKLEKRLTNLAATVKRLGIDKPVYVTEYGVKRTGGPQPGIHQGSPVEFSADVAFQHAWFNALAPQFGCAGLAKWTLFRTDKPAGFGRWGMIEAPSAGFDRSATYRVTRLFNHLVDRGWKATGLGRAPGLVASRFGNGAQESVVVLNSQPGHRDVVVQGLTRNASYFAVDWNRDGKGSLHPAPTVRANAAGEAPVSIPGRGVVGLSTRPLNL